jgi:hypothetical protein
MSRLRRRALIRRTVLPREEDAHSEEPIGLRYMLIGALCIEFGQLESLSRITMLMFSKAVGISAAIIVTQGEISSVSIW